jgi:hypothetical protein
MGVPLPNLNNQLRYFGSLTAGENQWLTPTKALQQSQHHTVMGTNDVVRHVSLTRRGSV